MIRHSGKVDPVPLRDGKARDLVQCPAERVAAEKDRVGPSAGIDVVGPSAAIDGVGAIRAENAVARIAAHHAVRGLEEPGLAVERPGRQSDFRLQERGQVGRVLCIGLIGEMDCVG